MNKTAMQDLKFMCNNFIGRFDINDLNKIIDKMIEREKQEYIKAFNAGTKARYLKGAKHLGLETLPEGVETGEQYYNQTYGQ